VVPEPAAEQAVEEQIDGVLGTVARHRAGDYPNFVEQPADASAFFDPAAWRRLREVKAIYDPQDLFKGNHHVPPAEPAGKLYAAA
jgi:hypothetical protein